MKKIILSILLFVICSFAFAINGENITNTEKKFKNIKVLKNLDVEEVKIEIKRPDNASRMPRMETIYSFSKKNEIKNKILKSNKLLY